MRVFLFKLINKQRWTLYIEKSEFLSKKLDISTNTTPTSVPPSKTTLVLNKIKSMAIESKQEIENAQSGVGLKGKLKALLEYMESKVHPEEEVIRQFSKLNKKTIIKHPHQHKHHTPLPFHQHEKNKTQLQFDQFNEQRDKPAFQIYYPSNIGYRRAQRFTQVLIKQRMEYHKKGLLVNVCLIPFTFAATILPGPNVFLAYNMYRCYGHFQAYSGCINLLGFSKEHGRLLFRPSLEMFECLNQDQLQQQQQQLQIDQLQQPINNSKDNRNSNNSNNGYQTLSERLRIPGLFEHVKRIESIEAKILNNNKPNTDAKII